MAKKYTPKQIAIIKKVKANRLKYRKLFTQLGYDIREHKYIYYEAPMELKSKLSIEDHVYDKLEDTYNKIARACKWEPRATDMVGFSLDTPTNRLVAECVNATKTTNAMKRKKMKKVKKAQTSKS